jgi:hypothetical protein
MTIREVLNQRKRRVKLIALVAFGVFLACCGLAMTGRGLLTLRHACFAVGLTGFAVSFVTMAFAHAFAFRCPSCGANLESLVESAGSDFATDRRVRCCPYCRADMDAEATPGRAHPESDRDT